MGTDGDLGWPVLTVATSLANLDTLTRELRGAGPRPPNPDSPDAGLLATYGGKAWGLAHLHRAGFRVPPTWLIPVGACPTRDDLSTLSAIAPRWAVRSSTTAEDDADYSHAGVYTTRLDVASADLPSVVGEVVSSATNPRATRYREQTNQRGQVAVAVVLQPFIEPISAGVWIGRSVTAGRLEWTVGRGERLVSGRWTPSWEEWPSDHGGAAHEVLRAGQVAIGRACLGVQQSMQAPLDLEFAVLNSGLVWLQCRPVTGNRIPLPLLETDEIDGTTGGEILTGTAASSGAFTGPVAVLTDPDDGSWRPGLVLVAEYTAPDWVPLLAEAGAVVTSTGGALCHAAIIARELGVPCVTGVANAMQALRTGMTVHVDGTTGQVRPQPDTSPQAQP
ncbi:MAG: PEP/pyruvate-binding domain-containing protein [Pseudonocardiaceae bacterium]